MRVLITGSTGMVGKNITEHSGISRYEVIVPRRHELNLLNPVEVESYIMRHEPDVIVHAAGRVGGIQANISDPLGFFVENLDMGRNVVMAAYRTGIPKLINLGSSCMYPREAPNPLTEDSVLGGELEPTNEGYALAKIAVAKLCRYITQGSAGDFQYKTLVPCNLFGRWDHFEPGRSHLIPSIIAKIDGAKRSGANVVEIWGDGTARREFMYATDFADCMVQALERFDTLPEIMNVGMGRDYSVTEYYEMVAKVIGYEGDFIYDLSKPKGMDQKLVDTSRQCMWGWNPRHSVSEGIEMTYQFFLSQEAQKDE